MPLTKPKPTVYVETTIPSYLAAYPSRDLIVAAHQQLTHDWWINERQNYALYISEVVLSECQSGDPAAAQRRFSYIESLPLLPLTDDVLTLAKLYIAAMGIPERSALDALHLACAVVHKVDYLLTWNCKHLAHGEIRRTLQEFNGQNGLAIPMLVTPEELMQRSD